MTARRIGYLAAVVTALASGWYFFVYLTKWEWNRALVSAAIFLAVEVALFGALALDRIGRLTRTVNAMQPDRRSAVTARVPRADVLARIRDSAPAPRKPFEWLSPDRSNVFVPVLLGAGVIISAIAWVVEKVARATAGPKLEQGLALRLEALAPPAGGLLDRGEDPYALFAPAGTGSAVR
jgi:hypothetical protein